jgi:hypothetical protein
MLGVVSLIPYYIPFFLYVDESREPEGWLRIASYSHIVLLFS